MNRSFPNYLTESARVVAAAAQTIPQEAVDRAVEAVVTALETGKAVLVCGNGGSAADADHIAGELVCRFLHDRRALKVISLSSQGSALTASGNDLGFEAVFARQVEAYGEPGGVLLGLSTSGNSGNILAAFEKARAIGMTTVALTGEGGGKLAPLAHHLLAVPSRSTPFIQQVHVCLYHYLCGEIETRIAAKP